MLGSSVSTLQSSERLIIIWFIVVFPVLILAAFCYLVIKHHGKLYAPKDYKKDESFLQTLNDFDSFVRLSTETYESSSELPPVASEVQKTSESQGEETLGEMQNHSGEQQSKDTKIDQDNASAVAESEVNDAVADVEYRLEDSPPITSIFSVDNDLDIIEHAKKNKQIAKMKELLELTRHFIENDNRFVGVDVRTNVKMGSTGVIYDAAAYTESGLQCLEVKYLSSASHVKSLLIKYVNQARAVKAAVSPADFHLKLVLVYDWDLETGSQLRTAVASVRQTFQDFISVELVQRSSISA